MNDFDSDNYDMESLRKINVESKPESHTNVKEWTKSDGVLKLTDEIVPYRRRGPFKSSWILKWGQRKLLLETLKFINDNVEFFNTVQGVNIKVNPIIIYAGAAPGNNVKAISRMYPDIIWYLYDPRGDEFDKELSADEFYIQEIFQGIKRINVIADFFTDDTAREWTGRDNIYFMSDIRIVNVEITDNMTLVDQMNHDDQISVHDMRMQERWHNIMKPVKSSFKFRLPFALTAGKVLYKGRDFVSVNKDVYDMYNKGDNIGFLENNDIDSGIRVTNKKTNKYKGKMSYNLFLSRNPEIYLNRFKTNVLRPNYSQFYRYLFCNIDKQPYTGGASTETRGIPTGPMVIDGVVTEEYDWNCLNYEFQLFYFQSDIRIKQRYLNPYPGVGFESEYAEGITIDEVNQYFVDNPVDSNTTNFDMRFEIAIIEDYLTKVGMELNPNNVNYFVQFFTSVLGRTFQQIRAKQNKIVLKNVKRDEVKIEREAIRKERNRKFREEKEKKSGKGRKSGKKDWKSRNKTRIRPERPVPININLLPEPKYNTEFERDVVIAKPVSYIGPDLYQKVIYQVEFIKPPRGFTFIK